MRTAPRDALLAESVDPARRGAAFGSHRAADHMGAVIGPLIATGLLLVMPGRLRTVFMLAAIPGTAAAVVAAVAIREIRPAARGSAPPARARLRDLGPGLTRYLSVVLLFTLGNASDAFLLLRASQLGVATALIPLLWVALHLSKAAWSLAGGAWADRAKPQSVIMTGWLVYAIVYAAFAFARSPWEVWTLFILYGVFSGLTEEPEKALVARLAPAELRGRAFGTCHFTVGLAALPASLMCGVLWQTFGPPVAFLTGAALALLAAALLPYATRSI